MKIIKDKLEKRGGLIEQMQQIVNKATEEKRSMTAEESARWDALNAEQEALKKEADTLRKQEELRIEHEERMNQTARETGMDPEKRKKDESDAFRSYLMQGIDKMEPRLREFMEKRTSQTTTTTAGGYLVPQGFQMELEKAMADYIPMWNFAKIIRTNTGNDIPWPTLNDTSNKGELTTEANDFNAQAMTFGQTTLKAYLFDSKVVTVSLQLLQDSALPVETIVAEALAERLGRILAQYFTSGTGSSQPQGCVYGAYNSAITPLIAGLTRDDIVDLIHSLDPNYRKNGTLMMNDSILKAIKKLEIGTGDARPLWQPSMRDGQPDTIEGYPYIINSEMDGLGASNKIMIFGDFSKFIIRMAKDVTLIRLNELYMANLTVGFISYMRASSHILNAGTNPIKYMACDAS